MSKLKIGFFGDGPWSHGALERIMADESIHVDFVCGRHRSLDQTLRQMAQNLGCPFFSDPDVNSPSFIKLMCDIKSHLFVSMSFNQIFKSMLFEMPKYKTINCHAGNLPFYRGRNILNWVLINDEKDFGITVHYIDAGIDTGDIILQKTYKIDDQDDYSTLLDRSYKECPSILYESIKLIQNGECIPVSQADIHPLGFYCSRRVAGDEMVDWHSSSREIFNFVRAICRPGPQATTRLNGELIKINRVALLQDAPVYKGKPGSILGFISDRPLVKTLDSFVQVVDFDAEIPFKVGDRFE